MVFIVKRRGGRVEVVGAESQVCEGEHAPGLESGLSADADR